MKEEFLNFIEALINENPEKAKELMTDNIVAYLNILKEEKNKKPVLTENGMRILKYLQEHQDIIMWKAKDIAEQIGISSRGVSGAMRKLVSDGFCEKTSENPIVYMLTEKGKNFNINEIEIIEGEK